MKTKLISITIPFLFRIISTCIVLYAVYSETGPFTVGILTLIAVYVEIHTIQHKLEDLRRKLFSPLRELQGVIGAFGRDDGTARR